MRKRLTALLFVGLMGVSSLFAEGLPKVNPEQMKWVEFGQHADGPCMTKGYDTDEDGYEDTKFHYLMHLMPNGVFQTLLTRYAIDKNRDKYFTDDEWIEYPLGEVLPKQEEKIKDLI